MESASLLFTLSGFRLGLHTPSETTMLKSNEQAATPRCVAVTGATGFIGRNLVRELTQRGHRVRALAQRRDFARSLPRENVTVVVGDIFDASDMDDLTAGADAMIHLIGIRREMPGGVTYEKLHVESTRSALAATERSGATRFLQMSALGARPEAACLYHRTKWEAEELVRASGLDWTILRPSVILGPDGEFIKLAQGWARGEESPKHFMPYFSRPMPMAGERVPDRADLAALVQPISVQDVARSFAEALVRPEAIGEAYALVGPDVLTWPQLLVLIRDATPGAKRHIQPIGIPAQIASPAAMVFQKIGLGTLLPFGPSEPIMATEDSTGSPAKVRADLGVTPASFEDTLAWSLSA